MNRPLLHLMHFSFMYLNGLWNVTNIVRMTAFGTKFWPWTSEH